MLVRFSSRVSAPQRLGFAALTSSSNSWLSRRFCSEKAEKKPEGEAAKPEEEKEIPANPHDVKKELEGKVAHLTEVNEDLKKELLYLKADADTARRIGREDAEKAKNFAVTSFSKDMLEVADTLERAIEALAKLPHDITDGNKHLASVLTGVKMSDSVLISTLAKHGIEKVTVTPGTKFDPNVHDALFNAPATEAAPDGTVATVVKHGYKIKDRVLRAAQVGVAVEQK